jgi:hypothetical protein
VRYEIDSYLDDIVKFKGISRNPPKEFKVGPETVKSKELYIGIEKDTTLEQFLEIQKSAIKAKDYGIKFTLRIEE